MLRSVDRGYTREAPIHTTYSPSSSRRTAKRDDAVLFNPYSVCDEYEDFNGYLNTFPIKWKADTVTTAGSPSSAVVADSPNGEWKGTLAATNEAESARLSWGDNRSIPIGQPFRFEAYVQIPVAIAAAQRVVIGLAHDYNATLDNITYNAWFRVDADQDLLVEIDDNTTDVDDVDTDLDNDLSYHLYTILSRGDGRFFFFRDENLVYSSAGLTLPAAASANCVQPFVMVQKDSGVGVPAVTVDFIRTWWERL